ncbi:MAG: hypothetical protein IKV47_05820, partial [Oscillospiraceae bacterium]|nr:hypothetical protein [Oscillospiraceae bacterium]
MNELCKKYIANLEECHRLARANRFPATETQDSILEKITANAQRAYQLRLENDDILERIVYSRSADTLTPSEVEELKEFAGALVSFNQQNDVGLSYKIHCLLFDYAKLHNDFDLYIRELYYMGTSLFYLNPSSSAFGINMKGNLITSYFKEGASYLDKLAEIESETTRSFVLRCKANVFLADEDINGPHTPGKPADRENGYPHFRRTFKEIADVIQNPYYQELAPSFNWKAVLYNLHFNRCLYFFNFQRSDLPGIVEDMLESAEYMYRHKQAAASSSTVDARVDYLYAATRRRAGLTDFTEVVETLLDAIENADKEDYSANGVTLNLQLPLYLEYTDKLLTDEQKAPYSERINAIIKNIPQYLKNVPFNAYNNVVNHIIAETVRYCTQIKEPVSKRIFDYLLSCHAPTYIHVQLTAFLGKKLFERIIDTAPHKAVGVFGINDVAEIVAQKEALAKRVYECSLYHDIGKVMLLSYVEIYSRKLLEEEIEAIQLHPQVAAQIVRNVDKQELPFVAMYHHVYNDGVGGYPPNLPPCPK